MNRQQFLVLVATLAIAAGCGEETNSEGSSDNGVPVVRVTGATGTQGGAVTRELLARGYPVRALSEEHSGGQ